MKKNYKLVLLAVLGLATVTAAHAATSDLLLGFNDAGATSTSAQNDYVIDLGAESLFTTTAVLNLSSDFSASTFNTAFSADGNYLNDVAAGAVAGNITASTDTLFQTSPNGASGLPTWTSGKLASFIGAANFAGDSTVGEYGSTSGSGWSAYVAVSPTAQGTYGGGSVAGDSANPTELLSSGIVSEELFESTTSTARNSTPSAWTEIGTLDVNVNTDTVTFNGVDAVPEPATYGLLAASGLLIVSLRRQFKPKNA
jgi:hypothetical protein